MEKGNEAQHHDLSQIRAHQAKSLKLRLGSGLIQYRSASCPSCWKVTPIKLFFNIKWCLSPHLCLTSGKLSDFLSSTYLPGNYFHLHFCSHCFFLSHLSSWSYWKSLFIFPLCLLGQATSSSIPLNGSIRWSEPELQSPGRFWTGETLQMCKHFTLITKQASFQKQQEKAETKSLWKNKRKERR